MRQRKLMACGLLAVSLLVLVPVPVLAGGNGQPADPAGETRAAGAAEEVLRAIPAGPGHGYLVVTREQDLVPLGNYKVYLAREIVETDRQAFVEQNRRMAEYLAGAGASTGGFHEPRLDGSFLTIITQTIGNVPLLFRQVVDIEAAVREGGVGEVMGNLRDPVRRFEFWKRQGIYDKYTPQEIAFMNSVAFPLAAVGHIGEFLIGSALAAVGANAALGPVGGMILGVGTLALGGAELVSMWRDIQAGRAVDPGAVVRGIVSSVTTTIDAVFSGTGFSSMAVRSVLLRLTGTTVTAAEAATLNAVSRFFGGIGVAGLGVQVAADATAFLGRLFNVWGVPLPAGELPPEHMYLAELPDDKRILEVWESRLYLSN